MLTALHAGLFSSDVRLRRARLSALGSAFTRVMGIGVRVLTVPLALKTLGPEAYGVWLTLQATLSWLGLVEFGAPSALLNPLTRALATGDDAKARELISSAFLFLFGVSLLGGVVFVVLALGVPLNDFFNVRGLTVAEVRAPVLSAILITALTIPLRLSAVVLRALQRPFLTTPFEIATHVVTLIGLWGLSLRGANLTAFVWVAAGFPALVQLTMLVWLFGRYEPRLRPRVSSHSMGTTRLITGQGALFFAAFIGEAVIMQSDFLVISHFMSASEVPRYAVPYQLFANVFLTVGYLAQSLWPGYVEAAAKNDRAWIVAQRRTVTVISIAVMCVTGAVAVAFGQPIIRWWAGEAAVPAQAVLWVMSAYFVIWTWSNVNAVLVNALGGIRARALVTLSNAAINLTLSLVLVRHLGAVGVALGSALAMLVTEAWLLPVLARRGLRQVGESH